MLDPASLYDEIIQAWRALPLGPFERGFVKAAVMGIAFFVVICAIERTYRVYTNYRSRSFAHDMAYWFYFRVGLNRLLLVAPFIALVEQPLSFLDLKILAPLPFALQIMLSMLIGDFFAYWIHRAQHQVKFLWAFHTTHHSQETLTFATGSRVHPIDHFFQDILIYVPLRVMGADPLAILPLFVVSEFLGALQHTQIPWKYGPLYKVFVSPRFHAYHHSTDPAHYNRNFAPAFSFWDYLFGTAVRDTGSRPTRFGLDDVKPTSLWGTLVTPFRLLGELYAARDRNKALGSG